MKNKNKQHYLQVFVLGILGALILFWISSSLLFINRQSFSVVTFQTKNLIKSSDQQDSKSEKRIFQGEFKSRDNNLGLIIIDLNAKGVALNGKDIIIFKVSQKNSKWNFQKEYRAGLFDSQTNFTFGFPVIENSKNKNYQFEIYSTSEDGNNLIQVKNTQDFVTGYQYSKTDIVKGNSKTISFISNKLIGSLTDISFLVKSVIYLLPLGVFLILLFFLRLGKSLNKNIDYMILAKRIKLTKLIQVLILLVLVLALLHGNRYVPLFIIMIIWMCSVISLKLTSMASFIICFIIVILWILVIPLGMQALQDIMNILGYFFLTFGAMQLLVEGKTREVINEKKKS